jgi:hypothetical protein
LEAAKRQKLHLVHLCSDKGPGISAIKIEKRNPFKAFGQEFEKKSFVGMHVADKKTLKKDSSKKDSLMARENYQEHVFQFDWSTLCSLFPIFIDV